MKPKTIVIAGAGLAGSKAAETAALHAPSGSKIIVVEQNPNQWFGGKAYSSCNTTSDLRTNTPAKRSGFLSPPDKEAPRDLTSWLVETQGSTLGDADRTVPRALIQGYIAARCSNAFEKSDTFVDRVNDSIVDIFPHGRRHVETKSGRTIFYDELIIATGNSQTAETPYFGTDKKTKPYLLNDPFTPLGLERLQNLQPNSRVLVLGTLMSTCDIIRLIERQAKNIHVTAISRTGNRHAAYQEKNLHDPVTDSTILSECKIEMAFRARDAEALAKNLFSAFLSATHCNIDGTGHAHVPTYNAGTSSNRLPKPLLSPEQFAIACRPYMKDAIKLIGKKEYGDLLRRFSSTVNSLAVSAGYEIMQDVQRAEAHGRAQFMAATPLASTVDTNNRLYVIMKAPSGQLITDSYDLIVNATGTTHNYTNPTTPLWQSMIDNGYAKPHKTGFGVQATALGKVKGLPHVWVVGSPFIGNIYTGKYGPNGKGLPVIGPPANSIATIRDRTRETVLYGILGKPFRG